jgi:hypothetical protein
METSVSDEDYLPTWSSLFGADPTWPDTQEDQEAALLRRYQDALLRIANEDYRGPEPWSVRQAREALVPPVQKADY